MPVVTAHSDDIGIDMVNQTFDSLLSSYVYISTNRLVYLFNPLDTRDFEFTGIFTNFDASYLPTGGIITGYAEGINGILLVTVEGGSVAVADFRSYVDANDWEGFLSTFLAGADTIYGSDAPTGDILAGYGGNDLIYGYGDIDVLYGDDGDDRLYGGSGNDAWLLGDNGNDRIYGEAGDDYLEGYSGNDYIDGGPGTDMAAYYNEASGVTVNLSITGPQNTIGSGTDTLVSIEDLLGSAHNDTLTGNSQNNYIDGDEGDDVIDGGAGDDELWGYWGDDILLGGPGDDIIDGDDGDNDTASYANATAGVSVDLSITTPQDTGGDGTDEIIDVENLTGSAFNDTLRGDAGANILSGGGGTDHLHGGGGIDTYLGGDGNDFLYAEMNNGGVFNGGDGFDYLYLAYYSWSPFPIPLPSMYVDLNNTGPQNAGGVGVITVLNIEHVLGSPFADTIIGNGANNILRGNAGNDVIQGGAGDDVIIETGANADTLDGGAGDRDVLVYLQANSGLTIDLRITSQQDTGAGGLDTITGFESVSGGNFDDMLIGSDVANGMSGNDGDDQLEGLGGDDRLSGGLGGDTLIGGDGNDTLHGDGYAEISIETILTVTPAYDTGGADRLIGGAGNDTINGGENVDTAVFSGNFADYVISTSGDTVTVFGPDGTDTLTNVEFLEFDDQTYHWRPGTGQTINFNDDPDSFMSQIRDFDGNDLGSPNSWNLIGSVDIQGDGDLEYLFFNRDNGRWATVGPAGDGLVYFDDHGWAGDTRVVGIYIDPLVESGDVEQGGPHDSQRRFQNDINIGNIAGILGADDYDGDGLQEVYFSLTDGTAYLHAYMHADGNIRYANYQNQQQVIDYLTDNGYSADTWDGWFPEAAGLVTGQDDFAAV